MIDRKNYNAAEGISGVIRRFDWARVVICRIEVEGVPIQPFDDFVSLLRSAFVEIGTSVSLTVNELSETDQNIVVGANALYLVPAATRITIPPNSIIVNLEQIRSESLWVNDDYIELLRNHFVWDYDQQNIDRLKSCFNVSNIALLRIGHSKTTQRLNAVFNQDIDVIFYGHLSPRREFIL